LIPTSFELDPRTTSTHVLGANEIDHVSKKYHEDAKDWVEDIVVHAWNDFHASKININFALIKEVDVKAN
jgi:hypothetical protein